LQQSYETILIYQKRREPCWTLSLSREAEGFPECIRDDEVDECLVILRGEGDVKLDVRLENDTVWLTQEQLSILFQESLSTINYHISNIFKEGELDKNEVFRKIRITTPHGAIEGLTPEEEILLLKACMLLPFRLGEFTSIDDILTTLHVKVIIDPRKPARPIPLQLTAAQKRYGKCEGLAEEMEAWRSMKLRGLYAQEEKSSCCSRTT